VIGLRLLKLGRRRIAVPESWLALYFLVGAFFGMGLSSVAYMSWGNPDLALPDLLGRLLHAGYLFGVTAGMGCLYVFTWLTFRPAERWARVLVSVAATVMITGFVAIGLSDGYRIALRPGVAHWVTWAARTSVYLWLLFESFRYWRLSRRRLRLGLAEPLVTNRFLLWSIYATAMLSMGMIDPLARFWYIIRTGESERWIPELGGPIVIWLITLSSALGILVMISVYLTFFPTAGYRRWVEGRRTP